MVNEREIFFSSPSFFLSCNASSGFLFSLSFFSSYIFFLQVTVIVVAAQGRGEEEGV